MAQAGCSFLFYIYVFPLYPLSSCIISESCYSHVQTPEYASKRERAMSVYYSITENEKRLFFNNRFSLSRNRKIASENDGSDSPKPRFFAAFQNRRQRCARFKFLYNIKGFIGAFGTHCNAVIFENIRSCVR